jgi:hypothetical protein
MCTINDERFEFSDELKNDIGDVWYDVVMFLALCETLREDRIDRQDFVRFEPFVVYGAHQLFGKYEFEKEKTSNPALVR